jgi:hypothetical protein
MIDPSWWAIPPIYLVSSNWGIISRSNDEQYHEWIWANCSKGLAFNGVDPVAGRFKYGTLICVRDDGEILAHTVV